MKRKLVRFFFQIFFVGTTQKRAVASSLGIFLGLLPLGQWVYLAALILSLLCSLNIIAVGIGIFMSLLIPLFQLLILPIFDLQNLITTSSTFGLITLSLIKSALISITFYPLFLWIYNDQRHRKAWKTKKLFVFHDPGRRWLFLKRYLSSSRY